MRKIGGLATAVLALSIGFASAAQANTQWITKTGETFDISTVKFADSALPAFADAAHKVAGYENAKPESLAIIGRDICEHYAGGFTTEDLRQAGGESLAQLGEAAISTVCG